MDYSINWYVLSSQFYNIVSSQYFFLHRQANLGLTYHSYFPVSKWSFRIYLFELSRFLHHSEWHLQSKRRPHHSSLIHNFLDHGNHFGFTGLCHQPPILEYSLLHRPAVFNILLSKIIFNYSFIPLLRSHISDFLQINYIAVFPNSKLVIIVIRRRRKIICYLDIHQKLLFHIFMVNIFSSDLFFIILRNH